MSMFSPGGCHHHHHGGPSVSRMTLSVPLICGYGSGSAGRSWTCRAVRSLGTGSSHLSLGYRLPSGGVLWRTVLDGDALPLAQMTQIVFVKRPREGWSVNPGGCRPKKIGSPPDLPYQELNFSFFRSPIDICECMCAQTRPWFILSSVSVRDWSQNPC